MQEQRITIFCSYAHEDQLFAHQLKTHFAPLERLYPWMFWTDMEICAGEEWDRTIQKYLNTAQVILLLISPDFMASDYCYKKELKRAMERHERGEAHVIPIIIRPVVHWKKTRFGKLQALPDDGRPITDRYWPRHEDVLHHVVGKIAETIGLYAREHHINMKDDFSQAFPGQPLQQEQVEVFEYQQDAYRRLIHIIEQEGAKEAVLIQYSCKTSLDVVRMLLRKGAKVTIFIQHEETAARIVSQFQAERILDTTRNLRSDLGDALLESNKLKVYKYRSPNSMSAVKIDQHVICMGWYTLEQEDDSDQHGNVNTIIELSGHDRAAVVALAGTNAFHALEKTFNVLETNYRKHAELVRI